MDKSGYILLHRKIRNHWIWEANSEYSKLQAWLDILMQVNHDGKKVLIGEKIITCKRGESCNSMTTWAKRWGWTRSKTRRFLSRLKSESMVDFKTDSKTTYLTVCNYNTYQNGRTSNEHQMNIKRTSNEHQMNTNKELKEPKELKELNNKNSCAFDFSEFDKFWDLYGKKRGLRTCQTKWKRLTKKEIEAIFKHLPEYLNSTPELKYRKDPSTYLIQKCWEDEYTPSSTLEYDYEQVLDFVNSGEAMDSFKRLDSGSWVRS